MGQVGKEFGVPGERDACFVDHAFMHRGGDHAGKVAIHAALCGAGQGLQHKGGIGLVQLAGGNRGIQRGVPHIQAACWSWLFGPVARPNREQADSHTELRGPLKEQVAAGNGNQGVWLVLRGEQQAQVGTYACRFAGCQGKTLCVHCAAWPALSVSVAPGSLIST